MRLEKLLELMDAVAEDAYPCKYGHIGCAVITGGRCSDELWSQQCSDETDDEYEDRMSTLYMGRIDDE